MPAKLVDVPNIGTVKLYKRKDARSVKLTLRQGYVRVTLPYWLPYRTGIEFVKSRENWIKDHSVVQNSLTQGQRIGKAHSLNFYQSQRAVKPSSRLKQTEIVITHYYLTSVTHPTVQKVARNASLKALKKEADILLPQRLEHLARKHGFDYESVSTRQLKSRWGSCSHKKHISLSVFLMQLPWHLIDYVILHELTHTEFLNHGADFWARMNLILPNVKDLRRQLRTYQPII